MKSILDPTFRYTRSTDTDLRKTLARIQRERRLEAQRNAAAEVDAVTNVVPIRRRAATSH